MDLVNKYLKLSEAWPGTPEWKKKHDPNYNPYDPEGKVRKALKQQPYGYRGKSAEGEEEEKPAEQPAMKKRGRPKKVREDVQVDEAAAEKTYNYAFDKVRDMDAKNPFSKSAKRTMYTKAARNAFQRMKSSGTKPNLPEEVEQIDELEASTLNSYIAKRQGNTANRMVHAMRKIHGKPSKHDVYNTGLKRAQQKIDDKRKKETGMNPQKPRPAQPPAYPLGGRDPASGRSYSESTEIDEGIGGAIAGGIGQFIGNKIDPLHGEILRTHGELAGRAAEYTIRKHLNKLHKALKSHLSSGNATNEEVEQVDELDKRTLMSYVSKAAYDGVKQGQNTMSKDHETSNKALDKAMKRLGGIRAAVRKIGSKKNEEVEQVDELSKSTLASYAKKASHDARIKMATGKDFERISKTSKKPVYKASAKEWEDKYKSDARRREDNVNKAIDRLAKEEVELDEISAVTHAKYRTAARADIRKTAKNLDVDSKASDRIQKRVAGLSRSTGLERAKKMNEQANPPFTPDKKKQMAVAGKYGREYSTARHLARMGVQAALKDLKKGPEKGSKQV